MPLAGTQIQPRDLAALTAEAFSAAGHDISAIELVEGVSICLAESLGYEHAWHDNVDATGQVLSRDVGLWQINIPASAIGTNVEDGLYDRHHNAAAMVKLWVARHWQPWASYNSTVYLFDTFIGRATRGVGNYLADVLLARPATHVDGSEYVHAWKQPVLDYGFRVAEATHGITAAEAALGWGAKSKADVTKIHQDLAATLTAMKAPHPS